MLSYAQKDANKPAAPPIGAERSAVESKEAPKPIGPYSQAIKAGGFVYCAGQLGFDPATGQLVQGDAAAQADRALKNLSAVLVAAGPDLDHAVKTTVFLKNIADFTAVNEAYAKCFNVKFETLPAGQFRHKDHRFEWTRAQFQTWSSRISECFGYSVRFLPIGEEDTQVGAPTQMGVFDRE